MAMPALPVVAKSALFIAFSILLTISLFTSFPFQIPNFLPTTTTYPSSLPIITSPDPPDPTFYDENTLTYSIGRPIPDWDAKRARWLNLHPSFSVEKNRVILVTGSQPSPCRHPTGDHLLLRMFKNKVDYCRIHEHEIFYNDALLHPKMTGYWAKYPIIRAAMVARPEAEWVWWVDSDAVFTDMGFRIPFEKYEGYNLVVNGWKELVYGEKKKSWTGLNAGVLLIRNCEWSMELIDELVKMGPQSAEYADWGKRQKEVLNDKLFPEADDQSGLIYLLINGGAGGGQKFREKVYLEDDYDFQRYWLDRAGSFENATRDYDEVLDGEDGGGVLRRRHAEGVSEFYGEMLAERIKEWDRSKRRSLITHFTGCEPCSGEHNPMYSWEDCYEGMVKALNFGDNQVLWNYGFVRRDLMDSSLVSPLI
ncbi:unnamed protein product [Linum trigynum]|uniref:Uncharacterized protein n=1 Tax=Linum trigynum TaxID=586398 RepID=A0AAV2GIS8_9ROSI